MLQNVIRRPSAVFRQEDGMSALRIPNGMGRGEDHAINCYFRMMNQNRLVEPGYLI